ncbi:hypothetical protein EMPS_03658 [Entomortierella parvispora]|uniref:AAA+ ATPase domain-containing protein n=1 Tax=Entomortierella parvispora TaxID=205924 RepID=A0A9P3H7N8_9FUNG|nr:hypothetical protein EMPS_03658 [Entomortierella parvispora]
MSKRLSTFFGIIPSEEKNKINLEKSTQLMEQHWGPPGSPRYDMVMRYWASTRMQEYWERLRQSHPNEFRRRLKKGYMEPIPILWISDRRLAAPYSEGSYWENAAEKRLYFVLNNGKSPDGKKHPTLRPLNIRRDLSTIMMQANMRMSLQVPIDPGRLAMYQSPGDIFQYDPRTKSHEYSSQVTNVVYEARREALHQLAEGLHNGTDHLETMLLIDVSGSMGWDPRNGVWGPDGRIRYHDQPSNIALVEHLVHRVLHHMVPRAQKEHPTQHGIDTVTFSSSGKYVGQISAHNFPRDWRNGVRVGGGTQVMRGWQVVKNTYFEHQNRNYGHGRWDPVYGWQPTPGMPKLSLLIFLDGEALDMDEFELELLGETWAYVTIALVGMENCPHHHSHAIELERVARFNPHVGFFDVHGRVCERMVVEDLLSSVYPVDPPMYAEILKPEFDLPPGAPPMYSAWPGKNRWFFMGMLAPITTPPQSKKARAAAIRAAAQQCFENTRHVDATVFAKALQDRRIDTARQLKYIIESSGYMELNAHTVTLTRPTFTPKPVIKAPPLPPPPAAAAASGVNATSETVVKTAQLEPSEASAPLHPSAFPPPPPPPAAISNHVANHSTSNGTHVPYKTRTVIPDEGSVTPPAKQAEGPSFSTGVTNVIPKPTLTKESIEPLSFQCDTEALRYVLGDLDIEDLDLDDLDLTDIFIDVGFNLSAKIKGRTVQLSQAIEYLDLDSIVDRLPGLVPTKQNRVIFGKTLHRAAAVLYNGEVTGITIRVGRKVSGLLQAFSGLVKPGQSILLCGAPNVGKTTTLRDLSLYLSQQNCLCLIDTSGEVCGDAETRKEYTGTSRVFRPEDPDQQYTTLVDCIRSHSPDIIAIDELNTKQEVEVCQTVAMRSIQTIACVHGDIEDVLYNPVLNKVLGGSTKALVSDTNAVDGRKVVHPRTTRPIFDIVVNIKRTPEGPEYMFIDDISNNIRDMLEGKPVQTIIRTIAGNELWETRKDVFYRCDAMKNEQ